MVNFKITLKIMFLGAHVIASSWLCFLWAWHRSVLLVLSLLPSCAHSQTGRSPRVGSQASAPGHLTRTKAARTPSLLVPLTCTVSRCFLPQTPLLHFSRHFFTVCTHLRNWIFQNCVLRIILESLSSSVLHLPSGSLCGTFTLRLWSLLSTNTNLVLVFHKLIISFFLKLCVETNPIF